MDRAKRAHIIGLSLNIALTIAKLLVGYLAASEALTADGFNSAGDIFATAIGLAGYLYARKPADDDHHYGHGNAESVAGLIIGGVLLATGAFIFLRSILVLVEGRTEAPHEMALWVAGVTILTKELLYRYTVRVGREFNSPSLLATARDHRADVLLAATVFAGILFARIGTPFLDPLAAALVGIYIAFLSVDPIRRNIATLMDQAPPELRATVQTSAMRDPDVIAVDEIRIHPLGSYYMMDLEIQVDGTLSLQASHEIAHRVADRIRGEIDHVQEVKVHVNPS